MKMSGSLPKDLNKYNQYRNDMVDTIKTYGTDKLVNIENINEIENKFELENINQFEYNENDQDFEGFGELEHDISTIQKGD